MLDRLQSVVDRYDKLSELLCDPDVTSDTKKLREYSKEQSDLQEAYDAYNEYKSVSEQLADAKAMQNEKLDDEMREMVKMEIDELSEQAASLEEQLRMLMMPKIRMTTRTSSLKFVERQAAMKLHYSQAIFTVCIPAMRTRKDGERKFSMLP